MAALQLYDTSIFGGAVLKSCLCKLRTSEQLFILLLCANPVGNGCGLHGVCHQDGGYSNVPDDEGCSTQLLAHSD
eukprot:2176517-Amphidinium_carterae.1